MTTLIRLLPERDPHPNLFEITLFLLELIGDQYGLPALLARWEIALLDELGFGLDLSRCAATGVNDALIYVSPRSGRAVSASAGEAYKDKLLPLPGFLRGAGGGAITAEEMAQGLRLSGYFLDTRVLTPRGQLLPEPRGLCLQRSPAA